MNFDIARMYLSQSVNQINTRKRIISTNQMIGFYWTEGGTICVLAWSRYSYFIFIDFIIFIFLFDCVGNRLEGFFNMTITTHDCCVMFMCKLVAYIVFLCWVGSEAKVLFRGNPDWKYFFGFEKLRHNTIHPANHLLRNCWNQRQCTRQRKGGTIN